MSKFLSEIMLNASLSGLLGIACMANVQAGTFYKWVDKNGSTHYAETPPAKASAKSAKRVYIDDVAPPSSAVQSNSENNPTSVMNSNELAKSANNASMPGSGNNERSRNIPVPQPMPSSMQSANRTPVVTPITPPPANRLIVPTQNQSRPVFSER